MQVNDINRLNGKFSLLYADTVFSRPYRNINFITVNKILLLPYFVKNQQCAYFTLPHSPQKLRCPHNSNIMKRLVHSVMQNVSIFNILFSDKADMKI